jgi:uncharacterized membrane protein YbaN (DUF454 family)
MKKTIFILLGGIAVCLGAIGIVTPVLPTTPFLLLATFLFSLSSSRLNHALLHNKVFGKFLTNYLENKPIPVSSKIVSISFLWLGLFITFYVANLPNFVRIILFAVGTAVTVHIILLGKFRKRKCKSPDDETE